MKKIKLDLVVPNDVKLIHQIFKKNGKKIFIVGGAVRDALLDKVPKDFDLATDALPDEVEVMLEEANIRTLPTGKVFGVINAFIGDNEFEIATFRVDQNYKNKDLETFKKYLKDLDNGSYEVFMKKLMK